ncbi:MAG: zinc-dependent peptidase, partial [Saprospiraceae bacterium]|nr:zinc-dependent peptidase [Saprospiraceae bacterium]
MLSNLLMIPPVIVAMISLYYAWTTDGQYSWILVPCLVVIAIIYVLSPQINWWWYTRKPPVLPAKFVAMLERSSAFYRNLSESDREKFRYRLALFKFGTDWEGKFFPDETVPPDVSLILSAQATILNFGQEKFLFDRFEKVLVFPRPFPSPEHPYEHASELYEADGCLLFSAEQVLRAFVEPRQWYNVALHEYARVFIRTHPQ